MTHARADGTSHNRTPVHHPPPPDQPARDRITRDLKQNFLVEAGAGSGKTTSLVDRMVALVREGECKVEQIAAVTFTRKAAAELRQRFQVELEKAVRTGRNTPPGFTASEPLDSKQLIRMQQALLDLDGAFLGTIHSFCAKLLRERPLEAELDPGFRELTETEAARLRKKFWFGYLERLAADGDPQLCELDKLGLSPKNLEHLFNKLVEHSDVEFGASCVPPPDPARMEEVRTELDELLNQADALLPSREPEKGWDSFAKKVRTLLYLRRSYSWDDRVAFFDALHKVVGINPRLTQNRWMNGAKAKALGQDFQAFGDEASPAAELLKTWWAHRYPVAVCFAKGAADAFAKERKNLGLVTFQDDLSLAAELLRNHPPTRRALGRRYCRLLVDEFQDTDPLQAEIAFLLASDPANDPESASSPESANAPVSSSNPVPASDWTQVQPRPGALFVVGDPKQSIYRFRRADIALYETVKRRFAKFGEVLRLEANFRSLECVEQVVQGVFDSEQMFPAEDQAMQAAFAPLRVQRGPKVGFGPGKLRSYAVHGKTQDEVVEDEARFIAAHINEQIALDRREPGDFMILTRVRRHLALYARVLEEWNLPVEVSGAGVDFEDKLAAFLLLMKCMADPTHQVHVLGVLTGPFFGITLDEIVAYRDKIATFRSDGGWLSVNRAPRWTNDMPNDMRDAMRDAMPDDVPDAIPDDVPHDDRVAHVVKALGKLHGWWQLAKKEPADVTVERLASEIGVFPLAAAGPLGQLRAGALVYLLDAVRAQALDGDASLAGAVEAMDTALNWDDAVVSLVPGRGNAVRVMNLHQAKGLEAKVVFLASPFGDPDRPPTMRVARGANGVAQGTMPIVEPGPFGQHKVLAQPLSWDEDKKLEAEFERAERTRLLYVAATRARDELWVARWENAPKRSGKSPWAPVEEWIAAEARQEAGDAGDGSGEAQVAARLESTARGAAPRPEALDSDTDLGQAIEAAEAAVQGASAPTYQLTTATRSARSEDIPRPSDGAESEDDSGDGRRVSGRNGTKVVSETVDNSSADTDKSARRLKKHRGSSRPGGYEWGSIVHQMLAAVEGGEGPDRLKARARNLLRANDHELGAHEDPKQLDELVAHVNDVRRLDVWARARASRERYTEVPFAVERSGRSDRSGRSGPSGNEHGDGQPHVWEGVIDLVFREAGGWVVADYKTDKGTDPEYASRVARYKKQVDIYAECWEEITGEAVVERMLVFTAQQRVESW